MNGFDKELEELTKKLKEINKETDRKGKNKLVAEANEQIKNLETYIATMDESFKKQHYTKQLKGVREMLKKYSQPEVPEMTKRVSEDSRTQLVTREVVLSKIVEKELTLKELQYSPEDVAEIVDKIKNIHGVIAEIDKIVVENGDDINKLEENIDQSYETSKNTNKELNEANEFSIAVRIAKIRLITGGILSFIGNKIFGVFGAIGGLFLGFKTGSLFKH